MFSNNSATLSTRQSLFHHLDDLDAETIAPRPPNVSPLPRLESQAPDTLIQNDNIPGEEILQEMPLQRKVTKPSKRRRDRKKRTAALYEPSGVNIEPSSVTIEPSRATSESSKVTIKPSKVTIKPSRVTVKNTVFFCATMAVAVVTILWLSSPSPSLWNQSSFMGPLASKARLVPSQLSQRLVTGLFSTPAQQNLLDVSTKSDISTLFNFTAAPPHVRSKWPSFARAHHRAPTNLHPEFALDGNVAQPRHWRIAGTKGQIAINIGQGFSHITTAFVYQPKLKDADPATSEVFPQSISLWAVIEGDLNKERCSNYTSQLAHRKAIGNSTHSEEHPATISHPTLPANITAFRLHHFKYMINSEPTQEFPIPEAILLLGITTRTLIFQVHSNWGNPDRTEVFQLGAYGSKGQML